VAKSVPSFSTTENTISAAELVSAVADIMLKPGTLFVVDRADIAAFATVEIAENLIELTGVLTVLT
jgi:hypothetical protein